MGAVELDVRARAGLWLAQDPDPETRAELEDLLNRTDTAAQQELHDRFDTRLQFGTAGLRGRIEAGSNRMNRVLVAQAAAGLAAYLLAEGEHPRVVIGYDGRKNSRIFAEDTAEIMAGAGVEAILLPRLLPTPVLAFAVRFLDASAGVMVTASHNPAADNGYKVYLGGSSAGSQIVSPADKAIAAHIENVAATVDVLRLPRSAAYTIAADDVVEHYVAQTAAIAVRPSKQPLVVYTALHGVGWATARSVFERAGFDVPEVVATQIQPDATFPTVVFPNPEEPGALDLAIARAVAIGADVVIANDPDADRLSIAAPTRDGSWERLSGNEVGWLLGWRAAKRGAGTGRAAGTFAASIVSSPALAAVARHFGIPYIDTLTGFKWISRVPGLGYGYEEALGYLVDPAKVRDKDGISAALDFLSLMAELTENGVTLIEHREDFAQTFGAFASAQISLRVENGAQIGQVMATLRGTPPSTIGTLKVVQIDDFAKGFDGLEASDILRYRLEDGSRVIVRPSGTEPKLKVYIDASSTAGDARERQQSAQRTVDLLEAAVGQLVQM